MCLVAKIKDFIKSTSSHPSTEDRLKIAYEYIVAKEMELRKGVRVVYVKGNRFKLPCFRGGGDADLLVDTDAVTLCRAWYEKDTITDKHVHKRPSVEYMTLIEGHCVIYFLNEKGDEVEREEELFAGMKSTIPEGTNHIVSFKEFSDLLIETIPKDKYHD